MEIILNLALIFQMVITLKEKHQEEITIMLLNLSNGDKILSENYLQHADHFTRILNERENFRKDKISETKSENSSNIVDQNIENSEHNSDKGLSETPKDEIETQNNLKSQVEIN